VTAVSGAFNVAAFLKGPASFAEVPEPWTLLVVRLVLVGGLAAAL
jgi:hypothetical protein